MYRKKIETELADICQEALDLIKNDLLPKVKTIPDAKVFYLKMRGDYYRYLCEFTSGDK